MLTISRACHDYPLFPDPGSCPGSETSSDDDDVGGDGAECDDGGDDRHRPGISTSQSRFLDGYDDDLMMNVMMIDDDHDDDIG